jgi:UDP-N-acetylmuramoyl-tripeptide--D-alanyl-D-alanine ligase
MARYAEMIRPDIVVVTSIKSEHNRSFQSLDDTRAEKVLMVRALPETGLAVLNGDDPNVLWMASQTRARVLTIGQGPDNDVRAADIRDLPDGTAFTAVMPEGSFEVRTRFRGRHMVFPFLAALAVAVREGVPPEEALARLADVMSADGRMQWIELPGGPVIVDDSFKGNAESLHAALDALAALHATRKIVVFGGVDEPPGKQGDVNREAGRRIGAVADRVLCLGKSLCGVRAGAVESGMRREDVSLLPVDFRSVVHWLQEELRPGDVVLVKGKMMLRLRRIALCMTGRRVACDVTSCKVKVASCEQCPLLEANGELLQNTYVARYVRE